MRRCLILTLLALAGAGCAMRGGPGGATWLAPSGLPEPRPPDAPVLLGGLSDAAEPLSAAAVERRLGRSMDDLSAVLDQLDAASEEGWRLQTELLRWFKLEYGSP